MYDLYPVLLDHYRNLPHLFQEVAFESGGVRTILDLDKSGRFMGIMIVDDSSEETRDKKVPRVTSTRGNNVIARAAVDGIHNIVPDIFVRCKELEKEADDQAAERQGKAKKEQKYRGKGAYPLKQEELLRRLRNNPKVSTDVKIQLDAAISFFSNGVYKKEEVISEALASCRTKTYKRLELPSTDDMCAIRVSGYALPIYMQPDFQDLWRAQWDTLRKDIQRDPKGNPVVGYCPYCGLTAPLMRIQSPLDVPKAVLASKQRLSLTTFNQTTCNSFGKEQGENTSLCIRCSDALVKVLSAYLKDDKKHARAYGKCLRDVGKPLRKKDDYALFTLCKDPKDVFDVSSLNFDEGIDEQSAVLMQEIVDKGTFHAVPVDAQKKLGFYRLEVSNGSRLIATSSESATIESVCRSIQSYCEDIGGKRYLELLGRMKRERVCFPSVQDLLRSARTLEGKQWQKRVSSADIYELTCAILFHDTSAMSVGRDRPLREKWLWGLVDRSVHDKYVLSPERRGFLRLVLRRTKQNGRVVMDENGVVQDELREADNLGRMTALICLGYGYYNKEDILPPGGYVHSRMHDLMSRPLSFPTHYKKFLVHCGGLVKQKKHLTAKVLTEHMHEFVMQSGKVFPKRLSLVEKGVFVHGFVTEFENTVGEIRSAIREAYERKEKAKKAAGKSMIKTNEEVLVEGVPVEDLG